MMDDRADKPPREAQGEAAAPSVAPPADAEDEQAPMSRRTAAAANAQARSNVILTGPVGATLLRLAGPMVIGILAIFMFQIVDTYFVGQLGPEPLAAMSFTFPVGFMVLSVSMGLGIGTMSVISRAIGEGNMTRVRRLTTHALMLALVIVTLVGGVGLLTIRPLFTALGAEPALLPLIEEYMAVYYAGVGLLVIPMIGNAALRATGDTKTPSLIMVTAGLANCALDPLLIFGAGPIPAMGLRGAAIATVGSWITTFCAAFYLLGVRERLIEVARPRVSAVVESWKEILHIGLPAAATQVLVPLSAALLMRMVASYGTLEVAGFGVGTRVEGLAMVGIAGLSTAMAPFVGQNFGRGNCGRLKEAVRFAAKASLIYGAASALLLAMLAGPIAAAFSDDVRVAEVSVSYLRTVPIAYAGLGFAVIMSSVFSAMGKPFHSAFLIVVRFFFLTLPLAYLGSYLGSLVGLMWGAVAGHLLGGLIAAYMVFGQVEQEAQRLASTEPTRSPQPEPA